MAIDLIGLHHRRARAIVIHPIDAHRGIEFGTKTRGKETVAEKTTRGVQNENHKLSLGNGEAMRANRLSQPSDNCVDVLDVVNDGPVRLAQTIVNILPVDL